MFKTHYRYTSKVRLHHNKTPWWLLILLLVIFVLSALYALPNLFGEHPAVQISSVVPGHYLNPQKVNQIKSSLNKINFRQVRNQGKHVIVSFNHVNDQLKAKEHLEDVLGNDFIVATVNEPATPKWLLRLNARPMKLGLDLQGGMSLLLQVDIDGVIHHYQENQIHDIAQALRHNHLQYVRIVPSDHYLFVHFSDQKTMERALTILPTKLFQYRWQRANQSYGSHTLMGMLSPQALANVRKYTMEQTLNTLNRRVNELGISESTVQQEGIDRILVSLPGVSDATQAQNILGKTATIQTYLVDMTHDPKHAATTGHLPPGDILLYDQKNKPV